MIDFSQASKKELLMNRRRLDWPVFAGSHSPQGRREQQKTGRNCLGPVTDSKGLRARRNQ
jgi:hypothetical protein